MRGWWCAIAFVLAAAAPGSAPGQEIIADCWEYEDEISGMKTLVDAQEYALALSASENLRFDDMAVDCHSYVREIRARIHERRGHEDRAIEEYLAIFDRDPQWRLVDASPAEEAFVAAVRSQWLQENPIGLRVTPRSLDFAEAPADGVELELTHDDRYNLTWRVKNKPDWVDVTKHGGRTEKGVARTRVILRVVSKLGRPGVLELECKPWAEVQVPVFGFERDFAAEDAGEPRLTAHNRRSGPALWLRILGGAVVLGGAGYVASEILGSDGRSPDPPVEPPFELPEPPDPPSDGARFQIRWRF